MNENPGSRSRSSAFEQGAEALRDGLSAASAGTWRLNQRQRETATLVLTLAAVTLALVFSREHGWYISDNKFVLYWNPTRALRESFSTWVDNRDLGGVRSGYSPVSYTYVALLRSLGASAWVAERLFHATLITFGALGTSLLCRAFAPRTRFAPVIAGLAFIAMPFTTGFVIPSWLYMLAVLSPWLALAAYRGVTTSSPWRWAAVFALLLLVAGSHNLPGLFFAALPLVPLVAYVFLNGETTLRAFLGWSARAGLLSGLVCLPSLAQMLTASDILTRNLVLTESVTTVNTSSSWSESIRGLGGWLLYFDFAGTATLIYARHFFTNPLIVVATFIPVAIAIWAIGFTRWKPRLFFGLTMVLTTMAMVSAFPIANSSPFGRLLLEIYRRVPATFAFRSSYKAGAGLAVATAILFAIGLEELARRLGPRRGMRAAGVAGLVMMLLASTAAFWTGGVYGSSATRIQEIPAYWYEATTWLDEQPGTNRALILPSALVPAYSWGTPSGGDIFPSLLERPHLIEDVFPSGPPDANNLVTALGAQLSGATYRAGSLAPVARRLGIEYVVVRNDLDHRSPSIASSSDLAALRADPDLDLVAQFGLPGENVQPDASVPGAAPGTETLPPVQIYRIADAANPVRAVSEGASLLVSGDGFAWLPLSADGDLASPAPIQYTGRLDDAQLLETLRRGSPLVVTDTNRRRRAQIDPKNAATVPPARPASDLFLKPGSQSVAIYGSVADIEEVNPVRLNAPATARRPAAAFDGDPSTAWLTGAGLPPARQGLRVEFGQPREISSVTVSDALGSAGRAVIGADVVLPDRTRHPITFSGGLGDATFPSATVHEVTIEITAVEGPGLGAYGLSEITFPGIDTTEVVQLPTDVADAAERDPQIRAALAANQLTYRFQRLRGGDQDAERRLLRRFLVPDDRVFDGTGAVRLDHPPDDVLADLLSPALRATGSERAGRSAARAAERTGLYAADGDRATAWQNTGDRPRLALRSTGPRAVTSVDVAVDQRARRVNRLVITAGGESTDVVVPAADPCTAAMDTCIVDVTVPLSAQTDLVEIEVVPALPDDPGEPTRIVEAGLNGEANAALPATVPDRCLETVATLDGRPVPMRLTGSTADVLAGRSVTATFCAPVSLTKGWHTLATDGATTVDDLRLRSAGTAAVPPTVTAVPVTVIDNSSTSGRVSVAGGAGTRFITGAAYTRAWQGTVDGQPLGRPVELDVQAAWTLPGSDASVVAYDYAGQSFYRRLIAVSFAAIVACLLLIAFDPRARRRRAGIVLLTPRVTTLAVGACLGGLLIFSFGVGGVTAVLLTTMCVVALQFKLVKPSTFIIAAVVLIALTPLFYFPPLGPDIAPFGLSWVRQRMLANALARFSVLLLTTYLVTLVTDALLARRDEHATTPDQARE